MELTGSAGSSWARRYAPRYWGEVLLNEIDSREALLLRQYFLAFEAKFPLLILRELSRYFPYVGR